MTPATSKEMKHAASLLRLILTGRNLEHSDKGMLTEWPVTITEHSSGMMNAWHHHGGLCFGGASHY